MAGGAALRHAAAARRRQQYRMAANAGSAGRYRQLTKHGANIWRRHVYAAQICCLIIPRWHIAAHNTAEASKYRKAGENNGNSGCR
jgi:hypothetical protein